MPVLLHGKILSCCTTSNGLTHWGPGRHAEPSQYVPTVAQLGGVDLSTSLAIPANFSFFFLQTSTILSFLWEARKALTTLRGIYLLCFSLGN